MCVSCWFLSKCGVHLTKPCQGLFCGIPPLPPISGDFYSSWMPLSGKDYLGREGGRWEIERAALCCQEEAVAHWLQRNMSGWSGEEFSRSESDRVLFLKWLQSLKARAVPESVMLKLSSPHFTLPPIRDPGIALEDLGVPRWYCWPLTNESYDVFVQFMELCYCRTVPLLSWSPESSSKRVYQRLTLLLKYWNTVTHPPTLIQKGYIPGPPSGCLKLW